MTKLRTPHYRAADQHKKVESDSVVTSHDASIESSKGYHLAATIDLPDTDPIAFAVFAHCFGGSRYTPGAKRTSRRLAEHGIAVCRFDFSGLGQSGGHFPETSFTENVADIHVVCEWLAQHYERPTLLVGHSLGGAEVLKAASETDTLNALATIGAPSLPAPAVLRYLANPVPNPLDPLIDWAEEIPMNVWGAKITVSGDYVRDLVSQRPQEYLHNITTPLLMLHASDDHIVDVEHTDWMYENTDLDLSIQLLENSDHLLVGKGTAAVAADHIARWAIPYLTAPEVG